MAEPSTTRPLRILLVTSYFEPDQGATAVLLTRLARQLSERGHQVTVLTTLPNYPHGRILDPYRGYFTVVEERAGVQTIQTWLWATPSPRISRKFISQISFMFTAGLRGLRIPQPDVILIEAQPIFTNLAGGFLSKLKRIPYVLNISDLWPDHLLTVSGMTEQHPVYRVARWVVDQTYRGAAGIVCASPAWEAAIQRYVGPTDRTRTIFYGVDLDRFRPGLDDAPFRNRYGFGDRKLVTFIGTFATQYDFDAMLTAAGRFADRPDVRFVLIGGGSQSDLVRARLAEGKLPNVDWLDWVDHSEIALAWTASHVTFWALRGQDLYRGTIPGKLYEAMACGTPIVAATGDVVADMLMESGGGFAVPFGDVDGMTDHISRLLDDQALCRQCSVNARAYAEAHFDANHITDAYEQALRQAALS